MVCNDLYALFAKDTRIHSLPVVDGLKPVGLINRQILIEQYSKLYFRELYGRHPISSIMEASPLVVDAGMSLDDLSRILVEDGEKSLYDGFIITNQGRYAGMGRAHDLMAELARRKQAHLYHIAHHDMLTGLPNRQLFQDRLRHAVSKAERDRASLAVLFIDLDNFKTVNDTLGHGAGDSLLVKVARRLDGCVRTSDTVARLGGDEFTIILTELTKPGDASVVTEKILRSLSEPVEVRERTLRITGCIGISVFPGDGADAETLVQHADNALYQAKEMRNSFQFFQPSQHAAVMHRHALEAELRQAHDKGEFLLHYQPQLELSSGRTAGVEALLRWNHPVRGIVSAGEFIELAEETGLIVPLGDWILGEACRQAADWRRRGLPELWMAVNVSGLQRSGFGPRVLRMHQASALSPSLLQIEITESAAIGSSRDAIDDLDLLRREGVKVAMDDFGSGYSSLSYLRSFSFDVLKIDRSFIKDLPSSPRDRAIAMGILGLARSLDIKVVAEGVETPEQRDILHEAGCERVQGFLYSPAVPPGEIEHRLLQSKVGV
ncbi:MAG TPA: EAL domain-containing protein [Planctomycetota bacterium]|nr:EAL domain-containing protein [Planctomycetota bacterium]